MARALLKRYIYISSEDDIMKKIVLLGFLVLGLQGCGGKSGDTASPAPEVSEAKQKIVKAVCYKNGQVVLDDSMAYDPKTEKNPESLYAKAEELVDVDHCTFSHH